MRYSILKNKSTKAERQFYEILKELHIPFKHRWIIGNREIDFLIGKYVIEIDGHKQDSSKNIDLIEKGYIPIHFNNKEINHKKIKIWLVQIYSQLEQTKMVTTSM